MPTPDMPTLLDLWLIAALGFLGSFGHCVGMCGPITAAFAISAQSQNMSQSTSQSTSEDTSESASEDPSEGSANNKQTISFHLWLNLGRLVSYALVGAAIGGLGSVVFAGGQMAGVGSALRRGISLITGMLLIWFGLTQAQPGFLPRLPFVHPAMQAKLHERLNQLMMAIAQNAYSASSDWASSDSASSDSASSDSAKPHPAKPHPALSQTLTPLLLGLLWGLIPCGFLYAGQLRAAETQSWLAGAATMTAFGLGTLPAMITMGTVTSLLSRDRRSQLFRMGGWLTVLIGLLLLLRTGDTMSDYSGHSALVCLVLALIARPISQLWSAPLTYRRLLGVGAFVLSLLHVLHMASHTWQWQLQAMQFMLPTHQAGIALGIGAIALLTPAALTSFNRAQTALGNRWRKLHLLSLPALVLAAAHTLMIGSSYGGSMVMTGWHQARVGLLIGAVGLVVGVRSPRLWSLLSQKQRYAPAKSSLQAKSQPTGSCHSDRL